MMPDALTMNSGVDLLERLARARGDLGGVLRVVAAHELVERDAQLVVVEHGVGVPDPVAGDRSSCRRPRRHDAYLAAQSGSHSDRRSDLGRLERQGLLRTSVSTSASAVRRNADLRVGGDRHLELEQRALEVAAAQRELGLAVVDRAPCERHRLRGRFADRRRRPTGVTGDRRGRPRRSSALERSCAAVGWLARDTSGTRRRRVAYAGGDAARAPRRRAPLRCRSGCAVARDLVERVLRVLEPRVRRDLEQLVRRRALAWRSTRCAHIRTSRAVLSARASSCRPARRAPAGCASCATPDVGVGARARAGCRRRRRGTTPRS